MDKGPLVSIIVPIFNGERYLVSTIDSVISQTHINWELILVDNGSTDGTSTIINRFVALDPRIRSLTLKQNSGGPAHPRNKGLSLARGDFVAFIDADDVWSTNKLSTQLDLILQSNVDLVHCGAMLIDAADREISSFNSAKKLSIIEFFFGRPNAFMIFNPIIMSSVLLKNSPDIFFREEKHARGIEDWLLWTEYALKGKAIRMSTGNLVSYRVHESSISALDGRRQYLRGFYLYNISLLEDRIGVTKFLVLTIFQALRITKLLILGRSIT